MVSTTLPHNEHNLTKKYLTEAPVLRYYDESKPVTVQCDGLGAVLRQNGQPVCYASCPSGTESRYAQIEEEMLAISWSSDKFDQYLYGRDEWKSGKCCEVLQRTALESKERQTRPNIDDPRLAQHPK